MRTIAVDNRAADQPNPNGDSKRLCSRKHDCVPKVNTLALILLTLLDIIYGDEAPQRGASHWSLHVLSFVKAILPGSRWS